MNFYYSTERNSQMMVALLKAHGIKYIVASPGATNISLVVSLQHDNYFQIFSCVDERSAAFMACGIASETGEPVVIICTESTASRNYYPAMTEAYHRKLPILAITGLHAYNSIGQLDPQVIDRSVSPVDTIRLKVNLPVLKDENDVWESEIKINKAILELKRKGGGPVHVNFPWPYEPYNFSSQSLPNVRVIRKFYLNDTLPTLPDGKIAIFVGNHKKWNQSETASIDRFCSKYNAVVFCGHSSQYYGGYSINANLIANQPCDMPIFDDVKLVIHIGEETSDLLTYSKLKSANQTWRVSEDGELRDTFRNLTNVFEMHEKDFFDYYAKDFKKEEGNNSYLCECRACYEDVFNAMPVLPFSNIFVASKLAPRIPALSTVYLGASNTIRAWSMFNLLPTVNVNSNMGTRGIDGTVSTMIGASLVSPQCIFYSVVGDLTFFYDMNVLGNRHIGPNVRIIVVNNGGGNLFKQSNARAHAIGDDNANLYVAAAGHWGNKSPMLLKHYAEDLGFEYLTASNKDEFEAIYERILLPEVTSKPMLLELFTNDEEERQSFDLMSHIIMNPKEQLKHRIKSIIGDKKVSLLKSFTKR